VLPTRTGRPRAAAAVLAVVLLAPLAACGGGDRGGADTARLTVLAASSLTDVFRAVGAAYERSHPGAEVTFSFAGSQELAAQVRQGAPADALVTADTKTMQSLASDTGEAVVIAGNRLVIAVEKGNPHRIGSPADLADSRLKVVLAAPQVPVGRYSRQLLDARGIDVRPVSQEPNVRAVLSKVELGEADAGLVYRTDATAAAGTTDAVDIPDEHNAVASYPAAPLNAAQDPDAAQAFVTWLSGPDAQKILRDAGFQQP
jgi:molybdate transport system substrate-binding protein